MLNTSSVATLDTSNSKIQNAMTVDVEEYFQVSAFEKIINRNNWSSCESRVELAVDKVLNVFDQANVKATFFTLAWIAEKHPKLIRKIVESGHEIASHGMSHVRVTEQNFREFKNDVSASKKILEDISGKEVKGYRAASFSIGEDNLWAADALLESAYKYSSSIYPVKRDCYGIPDAPRFAYMHENNELLEVPITTLRIFGRNYPCGGGGFFRLYPYTLTKWAFNKVHKNDKREVIFYLHPWELDALQPRQDGISFKTKFRHYLNLDQTEKRLTKLINDFSWNRIDKIYSIN